MDWKLLALTLAPGLAVAIYIYWRDRFDKEPLGQLIKCFIYGGLSTMLALFLSTRLSKFFPADHSTVLNTAFYTFISIGLCEEFAKMFFLISFPYRRPYFDEPYDGITYSVMISMGFATVENLLYVFSQSTSEEGYAVALTRMVTAIPAHASFAIVMGYFTGLAKFNSQNGIFYLLFALLSATLLHGAYDFFLMQQQIPGITGGAIVSLVISLLLSRRAIRLHQRNSPFNHQEAS